MRKHKTIPGLSSHHSGAQLHLEIVFDARPLDQSGAQWLTIHRRPIRDSDALPDGDVFPREVTNGEQQVRVGGVPRLLLIKPNPLFPHGWQRVLALSVLVESPYTLLRHSRQTDGSIRDEIIYPWSPETKNEETVVKGDLWSE